MENKSSNNPVNWAFLKKNNACTEGLTWWKKNCENLSTDKQLLKLIEVRADWANWLMVRILSKENKIRYAIYAAEQVLHIFEEKYPTDNRPREAILQAKKVLENNSKKNKNAYTDIYPDAAYTKAAEAAADAAYAAYEAAYAVYANADAAYAADAAAYAVYANNADAYPDNYTAKKTLQLKIINYGISLFEEEINNVSS